MGYRLHDNNRADATWPNGVVHLLADSSSTMGFGTSSANDNNETIDM
jgi:hypothetical protein